MAEEKRIVFIGPTGHGKSSTANSLLGKTAFNISSGTTSITTDFSSHSSVLNGDSLLVVDTPDINDQLLGKSEDEVAEELSRHLPDNIDAFVFVFKFGSRCTKDDVAIISTLRKIYGDLIYDHIVIVFTYGDHFDKLKEVGKYKLDFNNWLQDHAKGEIGYLLKECGDRIILYNNREKREDYVHSQRTNLLNLITSMKCSGESLNALCILHETKLREEKDIFCKAGSHLNGVHSLDDSDTRSQRKDAEKMNNCSDIDLLLIGKTGNGKSATGNSILRRKAFLSKASTTSVTKEVDSEISEFNGRVIKVVDGPGVGDTRINTEESVRLVMRTMQYAIAANPRGYHAFLLVARFGDRFTEEDEDTIKFLKKIFGDDFVRKFCILVLTCGSNFEDENTGKTITEWCDKQIEVFQELYRECEKRVILFDNTTKDEEKRTKQLQDLIKIVDHLASNGLRYTDENFSRASETRKRIIVEAKRPAIQEMMEKETSLILFRSQQLFYKSNLKHKVKELNDLFLRAEILFDNISAQDRGTGALHDLCTTVKDLKASLRDDIKLNKLMIDEEETKKRQQQVIIRQNEEEKKRKQKEEYEESLQRERRDAEIRSELDKTLIEELEKRCNKVIEQKKTMIDEKEIERMKIETSAQVFKYKEVMLQSKYARLEHNYLKAKQTINRDIIRNIVDAVAWSFHA